MKGRDRLWIQLVDDQNGIQRQPLTADQMMFHSFKVNNTTVFILAACLVLVACVPMGPTEAVKLMIPTQSQVIQKIRLPKGAQFTLGAGNKRQISSNSVWRYAGSLSQGQVYRPISGVLMIENGQAHEAYLVISDSVLVGFYFPGESNYFALTNHVALTIESASYD